MPQDLCKNVKEALVWQTPESPIGRAGNKKKKTMIEQNKILMERSPEKWKTMYRDQFRKFAHSPQKHDANQDEAMEQMGIAPAANETAPEMGSGMGENQNSKIEADAE